MPYHCSIKFPLDEFSGPYVLVSDFSRWLTKQSNDDLNWKKMADEDSPEKI